MASLPEDPKKAVVRQYDDTFDTSTTGTASTEPLDFKIHSLQPDLTPTQPIRGTGYGESKYDEGMYPSELANLEAERAARQSSFAAFTNGMVSRGASIVPKTIAGIGYVGGTVAEGMDFLAGNGFDLEKVIDNSFQSALEELDENLRENFPVYASDAYNSDSLLTKMSSNKFWFDDAFDGAAYMASAMIGGTAAFKGATGVMKMLKLAGTTNKFLNAMPTAAATMYNTVMEAGAEAHETNKLLKESLLHVINPATGNNYTSEEAKAMAAERAANTFTSNLGLLLLPNYIQSTFYLPIANRGVSKSLRKLAKAVKTKDKSVLAGIGLQGAKGMASEGLWEEGMQNAVQKYNERLAEGKESTDYFRGVMGQWAAGFTNIEGKTAMALGALLGGLMGASSGGAQAARYNKALTAERENWENNGLRAIKQGSKIFIDNMKSIYNEDGTFNPQKAYQALFQETNDKSLFTEALAAGLKSDPFHESYNNSLAGAQYMWRYMTDNNFDDSAEAMEWAIKEIETLEKDEQNAGMDISGIKSQLSRYQQMFEKAEEAVTSINDFTAEEDELHFRDLAKKAIYFEKVKKDSFESMLNDTTSEAHDNELNTLIKDSDQVIKDLTNSKRRAKIFNSFQSELTTEKEYTDKGIELFKLQEKGKQKPLNESEKKRESQLEYELYEGREMKGTENAIVSNQNPFNTTMDVKYAPRSTRVGKFGIVDQAMYDMGMDFLVTDDINNAYAGKQAGEVKTSDIISSVLNKKDGTRFIKEDDINLIHKSINEDMAAVGEHQTVVDNTRDAYEETQEDPIAAMFGAPDAAPTVEATTEEQDALKAAHESAMEEHKQMVRELESNKRSLSEIIAMSEDQVNPGTYWKTGDIDAKLRKKVADGYVANMTDEVIASYKTNPQTFTNESGVEKGINALNIVKSVFEKRKSLLETKEFKGFMKSIETKLTELQKILKKAKQNNSNKIAADKKFKQNEDKQKFTGIGIDTSTGAAVVTNVPINNAIREALGVSIYEAIMQEAAEDNFDGAHVEKILDLLRSNSDAKSSVLNVMRSQYKEESASGGRLYSFISRIMTGSKLQENALDRAKAYFNNPNKFLISLIEASQGKIEDTLEYTPLDIFSITNDPQFVIELLNEMEANESAGSVRYSVENLTELLTIHNQVVALSRSIEALESDLSQAEQIKKEKAYFETQKEQKDTKAPSNQQLSAIRQAIRWFSKAVQSGDFSSWAYIKGIAGTGKTTLVSRYIVDLLGLKNKSVLLASYTKDATDTLADSLSFNNKVTQHEIREDSFTDDMELLILDEVGALSSQALNRIAEVVEKVNEKRRAEHKKQIKVLAMGDPTQITDAESEIPAINNISGPVVRVKEMTSLSIPFRSDVSAILTFQNFFHMNKRPVVGVHATANVPIGHEAIGVHVSANRSDLIKQLETHKDSGRNKLIIVANEETKEDYKDQLSETVQIKTYKEAQGTTESEVYVDMPSTAFPNTRDYNRAMYVATSRPVKYMFVVDHTNSWQQKVDEYLNTTSKESAKKTKEMVSDYDNRLNHEYSVITGEQLRMEDTQPISKTDPDRQEEVETEVADITEDTVEDHETPKEQEDIKPPEDVDDAITENTHSLLHPTKSAIASGTNEFENLPTIGSKVYYVKTIDNKGRSKISILSQRPQSKEDGIPRYTEIGILSDEESVAMFGTDVNTLMDTIPERANILDNTGALQSPITDELVHDNSTVVAQGVINNNTKPLTYNYDKSKMKSGKGFLKTIVTKLESVFGISNGVPNGTKLLSKDIIIPLTKGVKEPEHRVDHLASQGMNLFAGFPYMILQFETSNGNRFKQYIRLNPRNINSKLDENLLKPLRDFTDAILEVEKIGIGSLGETSFNEAIKVFHHNYEAHDDTFTIDKKDRPVVTIDDIRVHIPNITEEQFTKLSEKIDPIIKGYYGYDNRVISMSEKDFRNAYSDQTKYQEIADLGSPAFQDLESQVVYIFTKKSDEAKEGNVRKMLMDDDGNLKGVLTAKGTTQTYMREGTVAFGFGDAQGTVNMLAKANATVAGTQFRVSRNTRGETGTKITTGKGLLATTLTSELGYFDQLRKAYFDKGGSSWNTYVETEEELRMLEDAVVDLNAMTRAQITQLKNDAVFINKINSKTLEDILTFDESSAHSELRLPLLRDDFNSDQSFESKVSELESKLESSFQDVSPTVITVEIEKKSDKAKPKSKAKEAVKKVKDDAMNMINNMIDMGKNYERAATDEIDLGKDITAEEARKLIRKFFPGINESRMEFLYSTMATDLMDIQRLGRFINGSIILYHGGTNTFKENVLRHEVIHKIISDYLTVKEWKNLRATIKRSFPETKNYTADQLEEFIADKFMDYKEGQYKPKPTTVIGKFMAWLDDILGFMSNNTNTIENFFHAVQTAGYTTERKNDIVGSTKNMFSIKKDFGTVGEFRMAKNIFYRTFKTFLNEGINGYAVTKDELTANNNAMILEHFEKTRSEIKGIIPDLTDPNHLEAANRTLVAVERILEHHKDLLKIIYPNWKVHDNMVIVTKGEPEGREEGDIIEGQDIYDEDRIRHNITDHTIDSAYVNQERKLSDSVKDFLSDIELAKEHQGTRKYLNPRFAYVKSMQLLDGIQFWENNWEEQLKEKLEQEQLHTPAGKMTNPSSAAINAALLELVNDATSQRMGKSLKEYPHNIKFLSKDVVIYSPDGVDIQYVRTLEEAKLNKNVKAITRGMVADGTTLHTTHTLLDELVKATGIDVDTANAVFKKHARQNTLRELVSSLGSLKERDMQIVEIQNKFGKKYYAYVSARAYDASIALKATVLNAFSARLGSQSDIRDFKNDVYNHLKMKYNRGHLTDKLAFVTDVLNEIGLERYTKHGLPLSLVNVVYNDIVGLFDSARLADVGKNVSFGKPDDKKIDTQIKKDAKIEGVDENNKITALDVLQDTSNSMLNNISNMLSFQSELIRPTAIKDMKGKKKYIWTPNSQAIENLKILSNVSETEDYKGKGIRGKTKIPAFMKLNFYKNNIFAKGLNSIYKITEHEGNKEDYGTYQTAVNYTREKFNDYMGRNFNAGFLAKINASKHSTKYTQYVYTISNKPLIVGAEIKALRPSEIKGAIRQTLRQIVLRESHGDVERGENNKVYNTTFSLLYDSINEHMGDGVVKKVIGKKWDYETNIKENTFDKDSADAIVDIMYGKLAELGSQVTDRMIKEKMDVTANLHTNEALDELVDKTLFPKWNRQQLRADKEIGETGEIEDRTRTETDELGTRTIPSENDYYKTHETQREAEARIGKEAAKIRESRGYLVRKEEIQPAVTAFVMNDYINSYQLTQIATGDTNFFKSSDDLLKRLSGAFAPGLRGLVMPNGIGMRDKARVAIAADVIAEKETMRAFLKKMGIKSTKEQDKLMEIFDDYEWTDAQGFMLPERKGEIVTGFGESYSAANVMKPAHYEIDEKGVPRMLKYSTVVLSDELVRQHEGLRRIRDNMRYAGISLKERSIYRKLNDLEFVDMDQEQRDTLERLNRAISNTRIDELIFASGSKVGSPKNKVNALDLIDGDVLIENESTYDISNKNYRLQLNPAHEVEGDVLNPSQLSYFLNILGTNKATADLVYQAMADVIGDNLKSYTKKVDTNSKLRDTLVNTLNGSGSERAQEILEVLAADARNKKRDMPWNFPTIVDKIVTNLSAAITNDVTKIKFTGSKLVLQSEYGTEIDNIGRRLQYSTDVNGLLYAEVILPRGLLPKAVEDQVDIATVEATSKETGRLMAKPNVRDVFLTSDLLGFRLPSSELHSAVPLKVVGFYDSAQTNVIIAPREIVTLHGSDYDVDSLFVIAREFPSANKNDMPVGYRMNPRGKLELDKDFAESDTFKNAASRLKNKYRKNVIIEAFLDTITSEQNRARMMTPITTKQFRDEIRRINNLRLHTKDTSSYDLSNIEDRFETHKSSFDGAVATGIFANAIKVMAYTIRSSKTNTLPKLQRKVMKQDGSDPNFYIQFLDSSGNLNLMEQMTDNPELWEDMDSLLNAAIDNVKEQILPRLGLNTYNTKMYVALRAIGINREMSNEIFALPITEYLSKHRTHNMEIAMETMNNILGTDLSDATGRDNAISYDSNRNALENSESIEYYLNKVAKGEALTKSERGQLEYQRYVLNVLKEAERIGEQMTELSGFLNIIRELPVFQYDIENIKEIGDELLTEYAFEIDNFWNANPHISAAREVLDFLHVLTRTKFYKNSYVVSALAEDAFIGADYNVKGLSGKRDDNLKQRDEIISFILSGVRWDPDFNIDDIKPIEYKGRVLTGMEAWDRTFLNSVIELQKHPVLGKNEFIQKIAIETNPISRRDEIKFTAGSSLDFDDIAGLTEAFDQLRNYEIGPDGKVRERNIEELTSSTSEGLGTIHDPSNIQNSFIRYSIAKTGLGFGASNYNLAIDPTYYLRIYRGFESLVRSEFVPSERNDFQSIMDKYGDITRVNLAMKHMDMFTQVTQRSQSSEYEYAEVSEGRYEKSPGVYSYYDKMFNKVKGTKYEDYIITKTDNITMLYRKSFEDEKNALYQLVGTKDRHFAYSFTEKIQNNGYFVDDAFRGDIKNVRVKDKDANTITITSPMVMTMFRGGTDVISITNRNDFARIDKRYVKINSITEVSGEFIANIETVAVSPIAKPEKGAVPLEIRDNIDITTEIAQDMYEGTNEHILSLLQNSKPIEYRGTLSQKLDTDAVWNELTESGNSYINTLSRALKGSIGSNIKFHITKRDGLKHMEEVKSNTQGVYDPTTNEVHLVQEKMEAGMFAPRVLMHEIAHAATYDTIFAIENKNPQSMFITPEQKLAYTELKKIYDQVKLELDEDFHFTNIHEFVAELFTNSDFLAELDLLEYKPANTGKPASTKTIFNKVIQTLIDLLGLDSSGAASFAMSFAFELINSKEFMEGSAEMAFRTGNPKDSLDGDVLNRMMKCNMI